jgi:hypothetical protein
MLSKEKIVFMSLFIFRPCDGLISRPKSPINCLKIKKLKRNECFTDALCSRGSERTQ